jgi:hypothetical protein
MKPFSPKFRTRTICFKKGAPKEGGGNLEDRQRAPRAICPGVKVRLRQDALLHVEVREWEFQKVEKGLIFLLDRKKGTTLKVNLEDIEWGGAGAEDPIVSLSALNSPGWFPG